MSRRQPKGTIPHQSPFRFAEAGEKGPLILPTGAAAESFPQPLPLPFLAEAMAQAILLAEPPPPGATLRLLGLDQLVLRQEVGAGDRLEVEVHRQAAFGTLSRYHCRALCGGKLVAEGHITVGY